MGNSIAQALVFLINTVFGLYILAVTLRFLLQLVRADFYNPISQALVKITNPPLRLLRRVIPGYRGIDWPSLVLALVLKITQYALIFLVLSGGLPGILGLLRLSVADLLQLVLYIFMFSIIIEAVMSWVNPGAYNPLTVILYRLNRPLLDPARRLLPPIGGLDFSPFLVLVALQLVNILLITPLFGGAAGLGFL